MSARARWIGLGIVVGLVAATAAFLIAGRRHGTILGGSATIDVDDDARLARIDARLQDDLLGNLLRALPSIRKAEAEKVRALQETPGAGGYDRFRGIAVRESDVDEFDALFEQTFGDAPPAGR